MKNLTNKLLFLISIFLLFSACKTTEVKENSSFNVRKNSDFDEVYKNALVLTESNIDSLLDYFKGEYTRVELERKMNEGYRWDKESNGWYKESNERIKLGWVMQEWQHFNSVSIYPNPTTSFVMVVLFKNMTESMEVNGKPATMYDHLNLQQYFPFAVSLQLILDEKIVWTNQISNCYG